MRPIMISRLLALCTWHITKPIVNGYDSKPNPSPFMAINQTQTHLGFARGGAQGRQV
jgi:hypothetical protein